MEEEPTIHWQKLAIGGVGGQAEGGQAGVSCIPLNASPWYLAVFSIDIRMYRQFSILKEFGSKSFLNSRYETCIKNE